MLLREPEAEKDDVAHTQQADVRGVNIVDVKLENNLQEVTPKDEYFSSLPQESTEVVEEDTYHKPLII